MFRHTKLETVLSAIVLELHYVLHHGTAIQTGVVCLGTVSSTTLSYKVVEVEKMEIQKAGRFRRPLCQPTATK